MHRCIFHQFLHISGHQKNKRNCCPYFYQQEVATIFIRIVTRFMQIFHLIFVDWSETKCELVKREANKIFKLNGVAQTITNSPLLTPTLCTVSWYAMTEILVLAIHPIFPFRHNCSSFRNNNWFKILQGLESPKPMQDSHLYNSFWYILLNNN